MTFVFRMFFKCFFLVGLFGGSHGLFLLPTCASFGINEGITATAAVSHAGVELFLERFGDVEGAQRV